MVNLSFFAFFSFEIVAKLIGEGFKVYFKDKFNWFDSAVVAISAVDIIIGNIFKETSENGGMYTKITYLFNINFITLVFYPWIY